MTTFLSKAVGFRFGSPTLRSTQPTGLRGGSFCRARL